MIVPPDPAPKRAAINTFQVRFIGHPFLGWPTYPSLGVGVVLHISYRLPDHPDSAKPDEPACPVQPAQPVTPGTEAETARFRAPSRLGGLHGLRGGGVSDSTPRRMSRS